MKTCSKCRKEQPIEQFSRNAAKKDGHQTFCKGCDNARRASYRASHKDKDAAYQAVYNATHKAEKRAWHIKSLYGLTPEDYDRMLAEQEGSCKVCGMPGKLHVDHDHETGAVRGLLCGGCNHALGHAGDNPNVLEALANYLRSMEAA